MRRGEEEKNRRVMEGDEGTAGYERGCCNINMGLTNFTGRVWEGTLQHKYGINKLYRQ